jgi:cytochrome c oxidase cbb3-type subunit 3
MSTFWSLFVIAVTVGMLAGCYWLLTATRRSEVADGEHTEKDHAFDGITELETPLPRWWYYMFVVTIVFAAVYLILYPGLGNFGGVLGWDQTRQWEEEVARAEERYAPIFERYASIPVPELVHEDKAMRMGQRIFGNFCSQCHGSAAQGAFGFPNLTDDDWLWGGSPEAIRTSIVEGRQAAMPQWEAVLGEEGIHQMTQYVLSLTDRATDAAAADAAQSSYAQLCASCHGPEGRGQPALGAPNLADATWLYGGSAAQIAFTLRNGRNGRMPAHGDLLDDARIHILTAYVYGLGDGARTAGTAQEAPPRNEAAVAATAGQ